MDTFIVPSEYKSIEFYILGSSDIERQSYIHVTKKNLFRDGKPEEDGPYDLHMGTTDKFVECRTCGNEKETCPGHDGHIILKYPVQSPLFRDEIPKYLKIFCHSCGKIITKKQAHASIPRNKLLVEYGKLSRSSSEKNPICIHCDAKQPHIERDKTKPMIIYKIWFTSNIEHKREQMLNTEMAEIFDRISEEDLARVGKTMNSHPRRFILYNIKVPSNTIRPDVKRGGDSMRTTVSDITTLVKTIVEINASIPKIIPKIPDPNLEPMLTNLDIFYYDMIRGTSSSNTLRSMTNMNKPTDSIAGRFPKKGGIIRKNLLGKRLWSMGRAVITGDKNIKINEVGVPTIMAKTLEVKEIVQEYNKDRLLKYFINKETYPGCVKIERQTPNGIRTFRVEHMPENSRLEIGDVMYRHLVTGDWVCFNRQPSLLFCSIAAHRVVVLEEGITLRLNSAVCNLYNADFDGDEMNLLVPTTSAIRAEIKHVSNVQQWFIGYKSSNPRMGCFQDSLIGAAELTRNAVKMDRFHAMDLMAQVPANLFDTTFPAEKKSYTGREIISMIIPDNTNYKGTASYYKKEWSKYNNLKYHPNEFNVLVKRGVLETGVLDKATVGQESSGGLFHIIHNEYGADKVLDVIYGFQQITNRFLYYRGFTVGLKDLAMTSEVRRKINKQIAKILADANDLTARLYDGKLVPPVGMTTREYYLRQMIEKLEHGDEFIEPLLTNIDPDNNGLYKLIFYGSKGKKDNILSVLAAIGQFDIGGNRFIDQFSEGRSNIYFTRFDNSPEAGGYITASYTQGIGQTSYIPAAQEARNGLINIALSTAVSGEQERKFIKSLETLIVNHNYRSMRNTKVIQTLYGETAYDPRKVESVKFPTISISDKEFEDDFRTNVKSLPKNFQNKQMQKWLDEEFNQLKIDRDNYRAMEFVLSKQNPSYSFSDMRYLPVNIDKIIKNISYKYSHIPHKSSFDPKLALEKVFSLCDAMGYRLLNNIQEAAKSPIPSHILTSIKLFTVIIRQTLCVKQLLKYNIENEALDEMITKIKNEYEISLIQPGTSVGVIAAQSVSEPLTQFVLDSKHRSGAKGNKTNVVDRVKEIASAKPTNRMKNPSMTLHVLPEFQENKQKIQEIANHIEMMPLKRFINQEYILFEEYGKPVHPDFLDEKEKIKTFEKYNFGMNRPSDLTRWVILLKLDTEEMTLKGMKIETIVHKIQDTEKFSGLYVMYSNQSAEQLYIRCYLRSNTFRKLADFNQEKVIELLNDLRLLVIRGVDGIHAAEVITQMRSYIDKDGSIKNHQINVIITEGTNLAECLENPYLDIYNLHTDSIEEIETIYGIDAARQKIITELKNVTNKAAVDAHYCLIADEMTSIGKVTSLENTGLGHRESDAILLRAAFHGPIQVLTKSAINNKFEEIASISSKLMMGTWPKVGTHYTDVIFHEKFVEENSLNAKDIIEALV